MTFFLGIDGGGSKTRCLLGDESSVLATGSSAGCNIVRVGESCARDSLSAAVHETCVQAGISPRQIAKTCVGIAGGARPEVATVVRQLMRGIAGGEIEVAGDMQVAFEDAFGGGGGVIIIAGTGSIVYGQNAQGETARAGGWGHAISDEGSGHWIGKEAIRSAISAQDQGETPSLLKHLMKALGVEEMQGLVVRANEHPAPDFAALFPVVLSCADAGDSIALDVLNRAGHALAALAEIVIRRLFPQDQEKSLATHGGVLASSAQVKESLVRELHWRCPQAVFVSLTIDPARGALRRARRASGSITREFRTTAL